MNRSPVILILVLIPLGFSFCGVVIGGGDYHFFDESCGATEFGFTEGGGMSLEAECGGTTTLNQALIDRSELGEVCVANLFRPSNLPSIIDDANNIGYHTVFVMIYRDASKNTVRQLVRFNAEYECSTLPSDNYVIKLAQDAFNDICIKVGPSRCSAASSEILLRHLQIHPNFFTDFKIHINNDQTITQDCRVDYDCTVFLCLYVAIANDSRCGTVYDAYFGVRINPYGTSNVYKTVRVATAEIGIYGSSDAKKDHFFYIQYSDLEPLIKAAQCTRYCINDSSSVAYCESDDSCRPGFRSTSFSVDAYPPKLIGDYTVRLLNNEICEEFYKSDKIAYSSSNIIFDEWMGGKPRCDCALEYGWNSKIQICEKCESGSSLLGCLGPCFNICDSDQYCVIDNKGIEQCVCKEEWQTLLNGQCQKRFSCDNGTVTISNEELKCQCNEGYVMSRDGRCTDDSTTICYDDLTDCIADLHNDTTCICPNGSVIESGMCSLADCGSCGINEECSVDALGVINCTCVDDYTRIYSGDSCLGILACRSEETLRVTDDMDLICNCKEGYLRSDNVDEIVCTDYSNYKFIRVFCLLWLIIVITTN